MVVCKFWKAGNCREGNNCRFEHPNNSESTSTTFGRPINPFANNSRSNGNDVFGSSQKTQRWQLNEDDIKLDLTTSRPKWVLSAYGPGKDLPASLFLDSEFSTEEVRWRFYQQAAAGNGDQADREAIALWQRADQDVNNAANSISQISKFMENKESSRPNRYDLCRMDGTKTLESHSADVLASTQTVASSTPFGQPSSSTANSGPFSRPTFGQSSSPFTNNTNTAFGAPTPIGAFGKPAASTTSAFGQSAFGQSPFSQRAASTAGSAFGQTGSINDSSPFGQAKPNSAFGKPSFGATGFGQSPATSSLATPSAAAGFGVGSGFVQSPFGQTAQHAPSSGFGKSPFAQPAQPAATSGFGQTTNQTQSPFNRASTANSTSPFGQAQPSPAFGQSTAANGFTNPGFGQSPFGQPQISSSSSPFGQSQQAPAQSGFGQVSSENTQQISPQTAFGKSSFTQSQQPVSSSGFGQVSQTRSMPSQQAVSQNPFSQNMTSVSSFGKAGSGTTIGMQGTPFDQPSTVISGVTTGNLQPQPQASNTVSLTSPQPAPTNGFGTGERSILNSSRLPDQIHAQSLPQGFSSAQNAQASAASKPTDKPTKPFHYTETLPQQPGTFDAQGRPQSYRGLLVENIAKMLPTVSGEEILDHEEPCYVRPDGKGLERIWFPMGQGDQQVISLSKKREDLELAPELYSTALTAVYANLFEHGAFEAGKIPLLAPKQEWVDHDV